MLGHAPLGVLALGQLPNLVAPPVEAIIGRGPPAPPPRRIDGRAEGDLVVAFARVLPGRATSVSLLPGEARGELNIVIAVSVILEPGSAEGEVTLSDDELLLLVEAA